MMFPNAWSLCGLESEPRFGAIDLDAHLQSVDRRYIHYAYAGGAKTDGARHDGYVMYVIPKAEVEAEGREAAALRVGGSRPRMEVRSFTFTEFCSSICVASGYAGISRVGLVRYVANKLGGVHWDNRRGAWTDPVGSSHRLLDEGHLVVGRLPAPLYEVLSIAEAVAKSADTTRLLQAIEKLAPEEDGAINVLQFREGRVGKYTNMMFNSTETVLESAQAKRSTDSDS